MNAHFGYYFREPVTSHSVYAFRATCGVQPLAISECSIITYIPLSMHLRRVSFESLALAPLYLRFSFALPPLQLCFSFTLAYVIFPCSPAAGELLM